LNWQYNVFDCKIGSIWHFNWVRMYRIDCRCILGWMNFWCSCDSCPWFCCLWFDLSVRHTCIQFNYILVVLNVEISYLKWIKKLNWFCYLLCKKFTIVSFVYVTWALEKSFQQYLSNDFNFIRKTLSFKHLLGHSSNIFITRVIICCSSA